MIEVDFVNHTYVCPFCECKESYWNTHRACYNNDRMDSFFDSLSGEENAKKNYALLFIKCTNQTCKKITVIAYNQKTESQVDILPTHVYHHFPKYIPEQIRSDYEEAAQIIELSPKAAATLLRRCLQGMISDFWGITKGTLNDQITALNGKVTSTQWNAIDGLRKLGNVGAHMEKDVNLIIDLSSDEANQLLKLIELLIEKWYIARHDEEELLNNVKATSDKKQAERKQTP